MNELDYIYLELSIHKKSDVFEESKKYPEGIFGVIEKGMDNFSSMIDKMVEFVKKMQVDLAVLVGKPIMKKRLEKIKDAALSGKSIQMPNFKKMEQLYLKNGKDFPKELKSLIKYIKNHNLPKVVSLREKSDEKVLMEFYNRRDKLENDLKLFEKEIDDCIKEKITYQAKDVVEQIDDLMRSNNIYINLYYKIIHEIGYFKAEYNTMLNTAERNAKVYDKKLIQVHQSLISKMSASFSNVLKKSIFALSFIVV